MELTKEELEAKKAAEAKEKLTKEKAEEAKGKEKSRLAKAKSQGFHNCTRVKLEKDSKGLISKFGATVNKIKSMHESSIDEYNSQQVNSGMFIKKDGVQYELVEVKVTGRLRALKMFMEKNKS